MEMTMTEPSKNDGDATDPNTGAHTEVHRWLAEMTPADLVGQMSQIDINTLLFNDDGMGASKRLKPDIIQRFIGELGIGSVLNTPSEVQWTARQYREAMIQINQVAAQYHRPPVIWGVDSVHGANYIKDATLTPQPINIAATFNTSMSYQAGALASRDTRAAGMHWIFAPLVGLAWEPKWSRVYETFGEDPLVVGQMAASMIAGIQAVNPKSPSIPSRAAACAKHFIGYSVPRTGHDRSPSWIPNRHLFQYFVPPWNTVLSQAFQSPPALTVMESYTETSGVPNVANAHALNYILRQRLRFEGVVITDYNEIMNLHSWHHTAATDAEAVVQALDETSLDMSMIPRDFEAFATAITTGLAEQTVTLQRLQQSAKRVLQLKSDLRMLTEEITIVDPHLDLVGTDDDAILPMVQDSLVLVQNTNSLLPLDPHGPLKVHVTGPTANSLTMQSGGWTWAWQGSPKEDWFSRGTTIMEAVQQTKAWTVTYTCGVDALGQDCDDPDETVDPNLINQFKHWTGLTPTTSMALAVEAAKTADWTIVCVGEDAYAEKPGDIRSLRLPTGQGDLVQAIRRNTNTKILLIYIGGRPRLLTDMVDSVDAILIGFLPGPQAGPAIVDVVTGRVNPNGRLPITYPAAEDGGGLPYYHAVTDLCIADDNKWDSVPCAVQWPFGHGLSYTTFSYTDFTASGGIDADLHVRVTVTNTGQRTGAETVMFFTFDESRLVTPDYKRLRAFDKISLTPGQKMTIQRTILVDELRFIGPHDDQHSILDPHMITYVGVGAGTDCRRRDDAHNPDDNALCVRLESSTAESVNSKPYLPACEAACNLWQDSGCARQMGFASHGQCLNQCSSVSPIVPTSSVSPTQTVSSVSEGWGWNYVSCLESVVWGMKQENRPLEDCWMMTGLCRDIFRTGPLTEFTAGSAPLIGTTTTNCSKNDAATFGNWLALAAGILASLMMCQAIRGVFSTREPKRRPVDQDEERYSGIQFTTLRNGVSS